MKFQSTDTNHYLSDKKAKFHHNRVVIFNIVLTLLISLSILGYAMYFNNNSTVVYSSTFTNFEPKNTIQIYSNSSSKIHFDSLCTTYFDDIIHIQIQSHKGLDNYYF